MSDPPVTTFVRPKNKRQESALEKNKRPCKTCQNHHKGCDRTDWSPSSSNCVSCGPNKLCEQGKWKDMEVPTARPGELIIIPEDPTKMSKGRPRKGSYISSTSRSNRDTTSPASTILQTPKNSMVSSFLVDASEKAGCMYFLNSVICASPTETQFIAGEHSACSGDLAVTNPIDTDTEIYLTPRPAARNLPPDSSMRGTVQSSYNFGQVLNPPSGHDRPQSIPPWNPLSSTLRDWNKLEVLSEPEGSSADAYINPPSADLTPAMPSVEHKLRSISGFNMNSQQEQEMEELGEYVWANAQSSNFT